MTVTTSAESGTGVALRPDAILQVNNLRKHFPITQGIVFQRQVGAVKAVDGITFDVANGETLGLVGESGCGKSTAGRTIAKLLEPTSGSIMFDGADITGYSRSEMRPLRSELQMIFQDPFSSLNPRHTVGTIVGAPYRVQGVLSDKDIKTRVQGLLERVGLNPEHERALSAIIAAIASESASPERLLCNPSSSSVTSRYRHSTFQFRLRS